MTNQEAKELVEGIEVKVLAVRMSNGTPKVTINWRDYLKVRDLPEHKSGQFQVAQR